jgi:hypothetical protein
VSAAAQLYRRFDSSESTDRDVCRHTEKTAAAILDKRNSNNCLCLIEPKKGGCGKAA